MKKLLFTIAISMLCALTIVAQQKTGTLKGKLEDEKGKPIADAEVRAMSSRTRNTKETTTDKEGNYTLELEPDDYTISFDAQGFQQGTMSQMQQVEEGKETKIKTLRLVKAKRTSRLSGAVFDERGLSLGGVRLKLVRIPTEEEAKEKKKLASVKMDYITNSRGEFAFRLPPIRARYQVTAIMGGYKPQTRIVDMNEDEAQPLAFTLEAVKE